MVRRDTLGARFWKRVDRFGGPDACWLHSFRHDRVYVSGDHALTPRRVAWLLEHGAEPPRYQHIEVTCGESRCVNPRHLLSPKIEDRFWRYVLKGEPNECWEWQSTRTKSHYGQYRDRSRFSYSVAAHRYAYELANDIEPGSLRADQVIMHTCDNPPCCNPAHLKLGTHAENHADMVSKGRHPIIAAARARRERDGKVVGG